MNKQQGFFFHKINPRLAITIIIVLAVFVGGETYWLSKSVSPSDSNKGILPFKKQTVEETPESPVSTDSKEVFNVRKWVTSRDNIYGFEYKYPNDFKNGSQGSMFVKIEEGKLNPTPTSKEIDGIKVENPVKIKVGDRYWYRYVEDPTKYTTCGGPFFKTILKEDVHLTVLFSACGDGFKPIPAALTLDEQIINEILSSFNFFLLDVHNWKTYSYTTYGTSFTFKYPQDYIIKVGEDNKIIIFPPGSEDNNYLQIMIGFLPFSKPQEFSIVAGTRKLHYDQNTNQWIVDGSPICGKQAWYFGTQNIPAYNVGSGKTDHPSEYVVIVPQGLLYFSGSNHIVVGLRDIHNTFTLNNPELVIKARCD